MENQWNNITLDEFAQIRAILGDEGRNEEDKMIALAAIMQGVSEDEILNMPLEKVQPIFQMVHGLNTPPERSRVRKHYQCGRWALAICETKDMSVAQWVDFQNYMRNGVEKHLADLMSVALVPIGKRYNEGYDIDELKADLRQKFLVCDAKAVCFFFQKRWLKSTKHILNYLAGWSELKLKGSQRKMMLEKILETRKEVLDTLRSL